MFVVLSDSDINCLYLFCGAQLIAGVNIDRTCAIAIEEGSAGNVTITLADGTNNILKSGTGRAGIEKNGNSEDIGRLTINGTGSLIVQGGENAAGIGGGNGKSTANIIIDNGNTGIRD